MNKRTIVFDLDDTISFCHNRDWPNARPNIDLIRRINKLYNDGWFIHIHSSRGQLSGTDYTEVVTKWLEENGVLYHKLEFGKPLAALYVDDKGISVDDFMSLEIEELPGGWSGSTVTRIGNKVFKKDKNVQGTVQWYDMARNFYNVPQVLSVTGDELVMRYIKPNEKKPKATYEECRFLAEAFQSLEPITYFKWRNYIAKIEAHCDFLEGRWDGYAFDIKGLRKIIPLLENMVPPRRTFCHGDLTPDNTVRDRKGYIYLIDPLVNTYSSYELDLAKLDSWALRYDTPDIVVNNLVVAETIRTLSYAPMDMFIKLLNICLTYLNR